MASARCPRPDKQGFRTEGGALALAHQMERQGATGHHVYRCVCGQWHVGRPTVNDKIRKALRRRNR